MSLILFIVQTFLMRCNKKEKLGENLKWQDQDQGVKIRVKVQRQDNQKNSRKLQSKDGNRDNQEEERTKENDC